MIPRMRRIDIAYSVDLLHQFIEYLNKYSEHYPCEQLMSIENLYHVCFEIAYADEIPLDVLLLTTQ